MNFSYAINVKNNKIIYLSLKLIERLKISFKWYAQKYLKIIKCNN